MKWLLTPLLALWGALSPAVSSYTTIVERAESSVVRVTTVIQTEWMYGNAICSGFVVADDRVLTANHCVGADMRADGQPVTVLAHNDQFDLALLSVATDRAPLVLRTGAVRRFEPLAAIGYAFGWTRLSVIGTRAFLIDCKPGPEYMPGLIVQPGYIGGMSGGPVIDAWGEVVGIVQQTNQGVGYGVGADVIHVFLLGEDL